MPAGSSASTAATATRSDPIRRQQHAADAGQALARHDRGGQGYWIVRDTAYLQQQTVNAQALSTYIQRLDNATLTALAEIAGAANRVPYFTGPQAMSLVPLQSSLGDATANALMKVGAFGLGALSLQGGMPYPNVTLNDLTNVYTGFYYVSAGAGQGGPLDPAGSFGSMIVLRRTSQIAHQIMTTSTVGDPRTFTRVTIDGGTTWGAWVENLTTNDAGATGLNILSKNTVLDLLNGTGTLGPTFGGSAPAPSEAGVGMVDGNFNTITVPGVYTIAGTWTNGPSGAAGSGIPLCFGLWLENSIIVGCKGCCTAGLNIRVGQTTE